jgi:hypothetical protein
MTSSERITVAETRSGKGSDGTVGREVSLPVVELLTGRGFVTGKSGSGKSNSAGVIAEELLEQGFGLLIVDVDGEYYGLKEQYEVLHCGADEKCDVQVSADHGERLAALAIERNVPIILDVSGFIDEADGDAVVAAVAKHLFAKAKKEKQPFLVIVEEVHEYLPENGSIGAAGRALIEIVKRGRKHGLGICGISQRPADVSNDFITRCDWLCWHRLTWNNDTKVVRRVLDGEYASAVEDLDDGEGFLVTDWSDRVRRVTFHRKRTFDAGATPGLGDVGRPDLESVNEDLLAKLGEADDEDPADDRIAALREQLDEKNAHIAELEAQLQDARDLEHLARQFVDALTDHVEGTAPGRTEGERPRRRQGDDSIGFVDTIPTPSENGGRDEPRTNGSALDANGARGSASGEGSKASPEAATDDEVASAYASFGDVVGEVEEDGDGEPDNDVADGLGALAGVGDASATDGDAADTEAEPAPESRRPPPDEGLTVRSFSTELAEFEGGAEAVEWVGDRRSEDDGRPMIVASLESSLETLDETALDLLASYRDEGPAPPDEAYRAVAGPADRVDAYAHNRTLRTAGLVEHVGRGRYDYSLETRIADGLPADRDPDMAAVYARDLEQQFLD